MNTITIELCAEDRARLDKIIEGLQTAHPRCDNCLALLNDVCKNHAQPPQDEAEEPQKAEPTNTQPEPEKPAQAKSENDSPAPEVSAEDIRSKYMSIAATPNREKARTLIKLYADKISDIPEGKRAEVLEKLNALEG